MAVAAVAVLVLLLGGGWLVWGGSDERPQTATPGAGGVAATPSSVGGPSPTAEPTRTTTPAMTTAPELVGLALSKATGLLPSSVDVETVEAIDEKAVDGTVLVQEPAAGEKLDGTMRLTVARRPVLTYLDSMSPTGDGWNEKRPTMLSGKLYPHSVLAEIGTCARGWDVEYNLSRGHRQLFATAGIDDDARDSSVTVLLEVFVDGRLVSTNTIVHGTPTPLDIDVTDGLRLKIQWRLLAGNECWDSYFVLGDPKLLGLPGETPQATTTTG